MREEIQCPKCGGTGTLPSRSAPDPAEVGGRIHEAMQRAEVTQQGLAASVGRTQTAVSYWVNGKRMPSYDDLFAVADALAVEPMWLLCGGGTDAAPGPLERAARRSRDRSGLASPDGLGGGTDA